MTQTNVNTGYRAADGGIARQTRMGGATIAAIIVGVLLILALAWYALYASGVLRGAPTPNTPATQSGQTGSSSTGGTSGGGSAPSNPGPRIPGY